MMILLVLFSGSLLGLSGAKGEDPQRPEKRNTVHGSYALVPRPKA